MKLFLVLFIVLTTLSILLLIFGICILEAANAVSLEKSLQIVVGEEVDTEDIVSQMSQSEGTLVVVGIISIVNFFLTSFESVFLLNCLVGGGKIKLFNTMTNELRGEINEIMTTTPRHVPHSA